MCSQRDWMLSRRRRWGVTLTEVVVGAALLAVAVIPLLRALTVVQTAGTGIEHRTQCLILAQSKLDEIRARAVHHYQSSFQEQSGKLAESYLCNVTDDRNPYLRFIKVEAGYDGNGDGRLSSSEVTVTLATSVARRDEPDSDVWGGWYWW